MAILSDQQKWMLVSTGSALAAAGLVRLAAEGGGGSLPKAVRRQRRPV